MSWTLEEIETEINADLNGEATSPDPGSEEWNYYLLLINRYQKQWAYVKNWIRLRKGFSFSTTSGQPTYSLPSLWKQAEGYLFIDDPISGRMKFSQIKPEEAPHQATGSYTYWVTGDDVNGWLLNLKFAPNGGGTGSMNYFSFPTNLSSPTDRTIVAQPQWLTEKVKSSIWEKDEDPRLVNAEAKADSLMADMLSQEEILGTEYSNTVRTVDEDSGVPGWGD